MRLSPIALTLATLVSIVGIPLPEFNLISLRIKNHSSSLRAVAQTPEERKVQADRLLEQGFEQYNINEFQAAINAWEESLNLYQQIGDRAGEGAAMNALGLVYESLGEYSTAIEYHQQTLVIARALGYRPGEGAALGNLTLAYNNLGEYAIAIEYAEQALTIFRSLGDQTGEGKTLNNLANTYAYLEEYAQAIEYYQQSLALARKVGDRASEGAALTNLGNSYFELVDYRTAIEYYQQSLMLASEVNNRALKETALGRLGLAYNQLGEYAIAIDYLQQYLALAEETGDRQVEAMALERLGVVYRSLGEYATAINYNEQSLALAQQIGDRASEVTGLNNLGLVYLSLGEYGKATEYYQQSLALSQHLGNRAVESNVLGNLGLIYYILGEDTKAIEYHEQHLAIARELGDRAGEGNALGNLGNVYFALGDYATGIDYAQQSLVIDREVGDRAGEAMGLSNLGRAFLDIYQLSEAEAALRQAIEVWETIREDLGDKDAWKVSIFEQQLNTYRWLQMVLIIQNRAEDALEISERGRARAFVELMIQRLATDSEITAKVEFPTLEQIKQVAQQQNAVLVEYSLIDDQFLCIWVIQPTGEISFRSVNLTQSEIPLAEIAERGRITASTTRIRGRDEIDETEIFFTEMIRGTRDSIGNSTTAVAATATAQPRINGNLQQLHQLLIEPIADLLPTDPNQNVIFIPQGSLFLVPFAALQDENGKYLIEKHTILTAPAIQVLELTQQQEINEDGEILIVGNPTMPKVSLTANQPPQQLTPLPGTEAEANAIASLLNAQTLIGDRATESLVKQEMPGARLIHLATHGLLEETDNGMLAAIALTPSNSDDGLLTPEEILSLDLNADLVVLSACDTGIGKITGDGVLGLSRSILTAGASSAIVSLWKVPDLQTSVLMSEFYRQWQQTGNKAQALRQAILTTMQQYPHPMNWAAFTLMGEAD